MVSNLGAILCEHSFFKERKLQGAVLEDILLQMQFAEAEVNETMFHHGQDGDLFYLIIEGSVEIRVPDFKNMQDFN